ncbi:MAG: alkaline phosphatase family protein [Planctomycetes bacterium]|nr:alkaline phosphatase family protein [Planctomycetota bacterium]
MTSMRILSAAWIAFFLANTASADEKLVLHRIAFGSCARQDKPQPIWDAVVATKPELFLSLGDNIYGDTEDMAVMKKKYDLLAAIPGWKKLKQTCPILATWDDHDYGVNDGGAEYPRKDDSQQLFLDFFGIPKDSPRRAQKGIYHSEVFGPTDKRVQVIVLDTRYFRSPLKKKAGKVPFGEGPYEPSPDTKATMLGEKQWQWLETQLKVPAKVRILVSSIQLVAQDHGWEKWHNFPHERERLYKLLKDAKASGLVCVSGDRHLAELSMMDAGIGYPLYDLTSSGLTEASQKWRRLETNRHRVATMNWGNNFGLITIDWSKADPLIRLQIRDGDGEVTIQEKLPLSLLQPGAIKSKIVAGVVRLNGMVMTPEIVKSLLMKEVTVEMKVVATGATKKGDLIFLNADADRKSENNFIIVLNKDGQASLAKAGIPLPRTHFEGKAIRVVGLLKIYNDRPEIIVSEASKIQVVNEMP